MIDLKLVSSEIREIISERQKSLGLVFEEDNHIYTMGGRQDYPSRGYNSCFSSFLFNRLFAKG